MLEKEDLEVARIFLTITKNWAGTSMLFPHRCKDGRYRNIEIKAEEIINLITKGIREVEDSK